MHEDLVDYPPEENILFLQISSDGAQNLCVGTSIGNNTLCTVSAKSCNKPGALSATVAGDSEGDRLSWLSAIVSSPLKLGAKFDQALT